jgi:hypothetical protein
VVSKDQFVGKAADELRKLYAPGVDEQHLRNLAAAALEAVGAWELYEAASSLTTEMADDEMHGAGADDPECPVCIAYVNTMAALAKANR